MDEKALYYIPPGPDVRELKPHEKPSLGMCPPYEQREVRTFEAGMTVTGAVGDRGNGNDSTSSSASEDGGRRKHKHGKKTDRGRHTHGTGGRRHKRRGSNSCYSSCDRSLSVASMGSRESIASSAFSTAASYDQYRRDRYHLRKYIGSGEADTASLRKAIDVYWDRYGDKGCKDRRLPHSTLCPNNRAAHRHSRRGASGSPCRCPPTCACRGGREHECPYGNRRGGYTDDHRYPRDGGHHYSRDRPRRHGSYGSSRPHHRGGEEPDHHWDRHSYPSHGEGSLEEDRRTSVYDDPHASHTWRQMRDGPRKPLKRGPRRLCKAGGESSGSSRQYERDGGAGWSGGGFERSRSVAGDGESKYTCDCKRCREWRRARYGSDDYVIVIGKDITRFFAPEERHRLAEKSGLLNGRPYLVSHKRPASNEPQRRPASRSPHRPEPPARESVVVDAPPPPAEHKQPAPIITTARSPPTAAAAAGFVKHVSSPTNADNYYHYFSSLPAAKMNSFRPLQVTEIKPVSKRGPRVQEGLRTGVESVGLATISVASD